jgi:hypothetical protein
MNNLPRQKLAEIVQRFGRAIINEPRRCEGLLRDYAGAHRREIAVLISAMEERVPIDLAATNAGMPREVLLTKLAQRLHDNLAIDKDAARWAVNSWAFALGVVSNAELAALEQAATAQPQSISKTTAAPAPKTKTAPQPQSKAKPPAQPITAQPITKLATDLIVSPSGGNFTSISEALRQATRGARLLIRPGLYREGLVIDKPVEIVGAGAREQIILESANASCISMQTSEAKISGLTLRQTASTSRPSEGSFAVDIAQGRLLLENCDITSASLSCVGIHNDATAPVLRRCQIHTSADSGIFVFDKAMGTLEECDIYGNTNVNVAISENAALTLKHCVIRDGQNAGIVAWNNGQVTLEECAIHGNAQAGLGLSSNGRAAVRRCRIYGGMNSGVYVHDHGEGTLEECDIYSHPEAEVAITRNGAAILRQCKIHNSAAAGVFLNEGGQALLEQCDIYANADVGVSIEAGGAAAIRACNINDNGNVAIRVESGAAADVENSDLTGNRIAAWETEYDAVVESRGNRP